MLRIAICDDVIEITSQLEEMIFEISKRFFIETDIEIFYSGDELLKYIKKGENSDLIFLDIEMERLNGIQVGNEIRESIGDNNTQIIFISGQTNYAMDLFKVRPFDFLVKPLNLDKVESVFLTFLKTIDMNSYFIYKKGHSYNKVDIKNISFFEANNRKVNIVSKDGIDSFYGSMAGVYEDTKDLGFIYIHKSYIVNKLYIKHYLYNKVVLLDDQELPISQSKRKSIRDELLFSSKKGV